MLKPGVSRKVRGYCRPLHLMEVYKSLVGQLLKKQYKNFFFKTQLLKILTSNRILFILERYSFIP
jgi:hypothetical protein